MSHSHHDDAPLKDQAWQDAWAHAFFDDPDTWLAAADRELLKRSFGNEGGVLMCIDEGVEPGDGADAVYLAGSGILYQKESLQDAAERRARLVAHLQGKGVTGVTSHTACGACALHCAECGHGEAETTAQEWSRRLADDLGVPGRGAYVTTVPKAMSSRERRRSSQSTVTMATSQNGANSSPMKARSTDRITPSRRPSVRRTTVPKR